MSFFRKTKGKQGFLRGVGSTVNIGGLLPAKPRTFYYRSVSDGDAICRDWSTVGQDLDQAIFTVVPVGQRSAVENSGPGAVGELAAVLHDLAHASSFDLSAPRRYVIDGLAKEGRYVLLKVDYKMHHSGEDFYVILDFEPDGFVIVDDAESEGESVCPEALAERQKRTCP